jgi:hypothetical protein
LVGKNPADVFIQTGVVAGGLPSTDRHGRRIADFRITTPWTITREDSAATLHPEVLEIASPRRIVGEGVIPCC